LGVGHWGQLGESGILVRVVRTAVNNGWPQVLAETFGFFDWVTVDRHQVSVDGHPGNMGEAGGAYLGIAGAEEFFWWMSWGPSGSTAHVKAYSERIVSIPTPE